MMEMLLWDAAEQNFRPNADFSTACNFSAPELFGTVAFAEGMSNSIRLTCPQTPFSSPTTEAPAVEGDLELRRNFVLSLTRCARHYFHRESQTHLFFAYYSDSCAVRSFHPYKDKAFETYLILANRLAMSTTDNKLRGWIEFIASGSVSLPQPTPAVSREFPCSGAVNFRLEEEAERKLETLCIELSISTNKVFALIASKTLPVLRSNVRSQGLTETGVTIRKFYESGAGADRKQFTVRIPKKMHAHLLAVSHELTVSVSAIASYLVYQFLHDPRFSR